jgi:Rieske Fe-S protein
MNSQITLPPTVNWFDEEIIPTRKWQFTPPVVTGHITAVQGNSQEISASSSTNGMKRVPEQEQVVRLETALEKQSSAEAQNLASAATDPFVWWSGTSAKTSEQTPGTFARSSKKLPTNYNANKRRKASVRERRQVVVGLLTGTAVVGILGIGGISFARFIESTKQSLPGSAQTAGSNTSSTSSPTQATQGTTPAATHGTQQTPTVSKTPKAQPTPTKGTQLTPGATQTPQPTPKPTQPPPTPTPTPPPHTGTVIGHTNMPTNSSVSFKNPADGQASWLVHMSNGNFVAVEQACTHAGVAVKYNASTGQFNCPAHGAIFNADGTNPQAPATRPLPPVHITVNADGTITTG